MLGASQAALLGGSAGSLMNGLVAWFPLNGDATDATGNGWSGTVNGATATTDRFGASGKAMSFNGVNNDITLNADLMDNFSAGTIALWIYATAWNNARSYQQILAKYAGATFLEMEITIVRSTALNSAVFAISNDTNSTTTSVTSSTLSEATWYHLAMTWDGSKLIGYTNGAESSRYNTSIIPGNTNTGFMIGRHSNSYYAPFNGIIDDLRMYNRALSAAEIQQLYGS